MMTEFTVMHYGGRPMLCKYDRDNHPWDFYWSHFRVLKELPREL